MTTVTGTVKTVAGKPDRSKWVFSSPLRKSGDDDSIVSTNLNVVTPNVDGILTVELDPGLVVVKYGNTTVTATVPDDDVDLWDLIAADVLMPPGTTDQKIAAATLAYLQALGPVIAVGDTKAEARAAIDADPVENNDGSASFASGASVVSSADPVKARAKIGAAPADGAGKLLASAMPEDAAAAKVAIGLPVAAMATWQEVTDKQARATRPGLMAIGDSITDNNQYTTTWTGSSFSRTNAYFGYGYLNCAMVWNRQSCNWYDVGISGQTAAQGLARFDTDVTALKPQVVVEAFATNDIATNRTAAATFADKLAMWRKAWAFGAKVVATNCPPRNTFTNTQEQEAHKLNALLRDFAATNPADFVLVDWFSLLADPLTGDYKTAFTTDGVHPNSAGAWALGRGMETALDLVLPSAVSPLARSNVNDLDNMLTNPLFTGTVGTFTTNKGVSGTLATGFQATSGGTDANFAAVYSKVARADGFGDWQQVAVNTVPNTTTTASVLRTVSSGFAADDIVRACVEFETDSAGWGNGILDCLLYAYNADGSIFYDIASSFGAGTDTLILTRPESGVLLTPPILVPAGTVNLQVSMQKSNTGTVRWGRVSLRKLASA